MTEVKGICKRLFLMMYHGQGGSKGGGAWEDRKE